MALRGPLCIFFCSLMAIPLAFMLNQLSCMKDPLFILIVGGLVLSCVVIVPFLIVGNKTQRSDSFVYVMGIFTFSSVIDLVIALGNDGIVADFMSFFLRDGGPHLKTAHGTLVSYWDGIAHFGMYLMILAAQSLNQSYRDVGMYWAASIGHSMLILLPGILMGPHGVRLPCLLNMPYLILPFYYCAKFYFQGRSEEDFVVQQNSQPTATRIWKRPVDCLFVLYFLMASGLAVLRFTAAVGGSARLAQSYLKNLEPYLGDTSTFPKVQMMIYLFYFLPYYAAAIYGLLWPGHSWMLDWSLLHAGAAAQGQFAHIGASFHYRTPFSFRVPQNSRARLLFWLINGSMLIVPQLFAYRCINYPKFFAKTDTSSENESDGATEAKEKKKV